MKTMLRILTAFALILALGANASATNWTNANGTGLWSDPLNWDAGLPGTAWIFDPAAGTCVISGGYAAVSDPYAVLGSGGVGLSDLEIRDTSSLSVNGNFFIGNGGGTDVIAELRMYDSATMTTVGWVELGQIGGDNRVIATGSTVTDAQGGTFVGNWAGTIGLVDLSGSAQWITPELNIGISGTGTVNVADSSVLTVAGGIRLGVYDVAGASFGTMNINGGATSSALTDVGVDDPGLLAIIGGTLNTGLLNVGDEGTVTVDGGTTTITDLNLNLAGSLTLTDGSITILGIDKTPELALWEMLGQFSAPYYGFDGTNTIILPEPATLMLLTLGGLAVIRRRGR